MVAGLGAAHGWVVDGASKHVWVRINYATTEGALAAPRLPQPRGPSEDASDSD
jgi:hypothetical protein